jgi:hypothetical protein
MRSSFLCQVHPAGSDLPARLRSGREDDRGLLPSKTEAFVQAARESGIHRPVMGRNCHEDMEKHGDDVGPMTQMQNKESTALPGKGGDAAGEALRRPGNRPA